MPKNTYDTTARIPNNKTIFLFRGRFSSVKGVLEMADAANILSRKYDDVFFLFVGEGRLRRKLEEKLEPIMNKAKAILTETGGLTSHAAIVSRELKKPCIVGIKNLLMVLKDTDLVEVDANNGIVRLLK